jgi:hypothetical protein
MMKSLVLSLILASPAFAAERPILYDCTLASSTKMRIPENRTVMTITTPNSRGSYKLTMSSVSHMGRGPSEEYLVANLKTAPTIPGSTALAGTTKDGTGISVTIGIEERDGEIGLMGKRYSIETLVDDEESSETWSCWSPQDPQ